MKRHPFNLLSLMFGIFLVLLAAWTTWFVFPIRAWVIDFSRWLLPAAAILVGAALLQPPVQTESKTRRPPGMGPRKTSPGWRPTRSADPP